MHGFFPDGPVWYAVFLFAITCHEAAHALVAKWLGDDTAYEEGQVTLNPLPHIRREPLGTVLMPLMSLILMGWPLGWASAPFDPTWQARHPHRAGVMALAGPVANVLIMIAAGVAISIGLSHGLFELPRGVTFAELVVSSETHDTTGLTMCLSIMFSLNLLLAVLNLIPIPPLDGATVIGLLFDEDTALKIYEAGRNPMFQMIGFFVVFEGARYVFRPVWVAAVTFLLSS